MERIIEDVLSVVDGDWEMMAAIFVLELDAVRGVVGIGDFTVYVSDGDGCQGTTYLNDVDIARKEELGEVLGFLEGKHRGLHVILCRRVTCIPTESLYLKRNSMSYLRFQFMLMRK